MNTQQQLSGEMLRDVGIQQVERHTSDMWKATADWWIKNFANTGKEFTAEDVRAMLFSEEVHPNAWGARFMKAIRGGIIKRVGYRNATRAEAHARALAVYVGVEA